MITKLAAQAQHLLWTLRLRLRLEPFDERGGGRNSDEGLHIGAGAVIAGTIAVGVSAFVANKLGLLQ
jgi:hypothetical protein